MLVLSRLPQNWLKFVSELESAHVTSPGQKSSDRSQSSVWRARCIFVSEAAWYDGDRRPLYPARGRVLDRVRVPAVQEDRADHHPRQGHEGVRRPLRVLGGDGQALRDLRPHHRRRQVVPLRRVQDLPDLRDRLRGRHLRAHHGRLEHEVRRAHRDRVRARRAHLDGRGLPRHDDRRLLQRAVRVRARRSPRARARARRSSPRISLSAPPPVRAPRAVSRPLLPPPRRDIAARRSRRPRRRRTCSRARSTPRSARAR